MLLSSISLALTRLCTNATGPDGIAAPALTLEDATSILLLEDGGYLLLEG